MIPIFFIIYLSNIILGFFGMHLILTIQKQHLDLMNWFRLWYFFYDNFNALNTFSYKMRCAYYYKSSLTDKETNWHSIRFYARSILNLFFFKKSFQICNMKLSFERYGNSKGYTENLKIMTRVIKTYSFEIFWAIKFHCRN